MKVIQNDSPPVTHEFMATLEFRAVKQFRGLSQQQRLRKAHNAVDYIRPLHAAAVLLMAMSKPELIAKSREDHDKMGNMLMLLLEGEKTTRAILEIMKSAQIRLASALANVEPPDDGTAAAS